jgi:glycosyltransferase involved in cell wall biosynthesis
MKITIITAVYNRKNSIEQAVMSVQKQSYQNIEHLVIDGSSTDGTLEIIKNCQDDRLRLISEPDYGIYDALNKGLKLAQGDVVGVMHSDDSSVALLDHVPVSIKSTVLLVILALGYLNLKKAALSTKIWGIMTVLSIANIVVAVFL